MTLLREKIDHELAGLDNRAMAAVYEHLRLLKTMRQQPKQKRPVLDIEYIQKLTETSKRNWGQIVTADRDERL
jgi:hypothetical protein